MILTSVAAKAAVARLCACSRLNDGRDELEKMTIARTIAAMAKVNADQTRLLIGDSC